MATTLTSYVTIQGRDSRVIRGTVGTAVGLLCIVKEPVVRLTISNADATAANTVELFVARFNPADQTRFGGTDGTVGQGYPVNGQATQTIYLREGDVLTAKAAADRDIAIFVAVEGSAG